MRPRLTVAGWICAGLGFLTMLAALVLPWAHYRLQAQTPIGAIGLDQSGRLSLLNLHNGKLYLILVLGSCVGFAAALGGQGWLHRVGGLVGVLTGIAGAVLAARMGSSISQSAGDTAFAGFVAVNSHLEPGSAIPFGVVAPLFIGAAAALLGAARAKETP